MLGLALRGLWVILLMLFWVPGVLLPVGCIIQILVALRGFGCCEFGLMGSCGWCVGGLVGFVVIWWVSLSWGWVGGFCDLVWFGGISVASG